MGFVALIMQKVKVIMIHAREFVKIYTLEEENKTMLKTQIIEKRKSIRRYDPKKLDSETLKKVKEQLEKLTPLYSNIGYRVEIVDKTKRAFGINAPHYLLFYSEEKKGAYENIGFIGQQMDLFFSENGLGSCWVGVAKPEDKKVEEAKKSEKEIYIICISFGKPAETLHRERKDFRRKPLSKMSQGDDPRLEAARLAPSGVNAQNWFFSHEAGKIHCYCKKTSGLKKLFLGKLALIDLGIAICHIAKESDDFKFIHEDTAPKKEGYFYVGTAV